MAISEAIVGGIIGAAGTGIVGWMLFWRKERIRRKRLENMLTAELESMSGFQGIEKLDEKVPHTGSFPTYVYENNVNQIGRLEDAEKVVEFYTMLLANKEFARYEDEKEESNWGPIHNNLDTLGNKRDDLIDLLS